METLASSFDETMTFNVVNGGVLTCAGEAVVLLAAALVSALVKTSLVVLTQFSSFISAASILLQKRKEKEKDLLHVEIFF
ncbi:unnamed protein product [Coffea canephora]|uniref:Uncharacterized protein n=1 Tax=Coffea canephora TaxID=49390 RepID=A0A068TZA3_COFCA|nr:unnamed protein product [Coffea canephora]